MKEMKVRCTSREYADRVIEVADRLGYGIFNDYMQKREWDTLILHGAGSAGFWHFSEYDYPEYALYGDHLLPVSEGWIENRGECPVAKGTKIDVLYRDGAIVRSVGASDGSYSKVEGSPDDERGAVFWGPSGAPADIIAYRLAEQAADDLRPVRPVRSERNKAAAEVVAQPTTEVSLRDRFAGKALAALLIANPDADCGPEGYAKDAYLYADAMMKVRGE